MNLKQELKDKMNRIEITNCFIENLNHYLGDNIKELKTNASLLELTTKKGQKRKIHICGLYGKIEEGAFGEYCKGFKSFLSIKVEYIEKETSIYDIFNLMDNNEPTNIDNYVVFNVYKNCFEIYDAKIVRNILNKFTLDNLKTTKWGNCLVHYLLIDTKYLVNAKQVTYNNINPNFIDIAILNPVIHINDIGEDVLPF